MCLIYRSDDFHNCVRIRLLPEEGSTYERSHWHVKKLLVLVLNYIFL